MRVFGFMVLGVLLMGCNGGSDPEPTRVDDILALTGDPVNGESLWNAQCASCHSGMEAPFGDRPEEDQVNAMLTGPGSMPDFSGFADQDIADIVAYLVSSAP